MAMAMCAQTAPLPELLPCTPGQIAGVGHSEALLAMAVGDDVSPPPLVEGSPSVSPGDALTPSRASSGFRRTPGRPCSGSGVSAISPGSLCVMLELLNNCVAQEATSPGDMDAELLAAFPATPTLATLPALLPHAPMPELTAADSPALPEMPELTSASPDYPLPELAAVSTPERCPLPELLTAPTPSPSPGPLPELTSGSPVLPAMPGLTEASPGPLPALTEQTSPPSMPGLVHAPKGEVPAAVAPPPLPSLLSLSPEPRAAPGVQVLAGRFGAPAAMSRTAPVPPQVSTAMCDLSSIDRRV